MPPQTTSGSGVRVPATKESEDAAVGEGDHAAMTVLPPLPPPTCPICFEPWTCSGGHRICCIPCGHVYGRSCLERWLDRSALNSAKCPQCGEQFEGNVIINLYAPENLWDGCLQAFDAHLQSVRKEMEGRCKSVLAEYTEKTDLEIDKVRAEVMELAAKMEADRESFRAEAEQMLDSLTAMKERMRKMVEEENATAKDLIEFVQRILSQRSLISIPRASACVSAPAPVDSENNARNQPDPAGPADAVKRRRRRRS